LVGALASGIGQGLKLGLSLATNIVRVPNLTKKQLFFAIKNDILYWYQHQRSREATNNIDLKKTKKIEQNHKNLKEILIVTSKKCYRLIAEDEKVALKWLNSLTEAKKKD
jgi:hypothetical protein